MQDENNRAPPDTMVRPIDRQDLSELELVWSIYHQSIPPAEQKPRQLFIDQLSRSEYDCSVVTRDGRVVGFALVWNSPARAFRLLEYMAIDQTHRSSGYGELLMATVTASSAEDQPLIIEVESPEDTTLSADEREQSRRRLGFYARAGCRLVGSFEYAMPQLTETAPPKMRLLLASNFTAAQISREDLERMVGAIYFGVYARPAPDSMLSHMFRDSPPSFPVLATK